MFAPGIRENRSDDDSPATIPYPVVFPLPGGRSVATATWFAASPDEGPSHGDPAPLASSAERRRSLARRLARCRFSVGYGEPAEPLPPAEHLEPSPT